MAQRPPKGLMGHFKVWPALGLRLRNGRVVKRRKGLQYFHISILPTKRQMYEFHIADCRKTGDRTVKNCM